jgi:transcription elongation factor GreB
VSKAFVREFEDEPEEPLFVRQATPLPPGVKNYMTEDGAKRVREELERLIQVERPLLARLTEDLDAKRELQAVNQRVRILQQTIESAEVVIPTGEPDLVRFGVTVTVREPEGTEASYRLVGIEETDTDKGWISWQSPLAKALMNARPGDTVTFASPSGPRNLTILSLKYEK